MHMLQSQFEQYLQSCGVSVLSLKNYRSDLSHFLSWAASELKLSGSYIQDISEVVPFLNRNFIILYKNSLVSAHTAYRSINRRLSTLRHFSAFLVKNGLVDYDFMSDIPNLGFSKNVSNVFQKLIYDFTKHLEAQKVSKNTIKSYQSDVGQFIAWLNKNYVHTS